MAHTITLDDKMNLIDRDTIQDFVDLFFDARDSDFQIEVVPTYGKVPNGNIRGQCLASSRGRIRISIYAGNIKNHMERGLALGGNTTRATDLKLGVYLVLTHELRHAYQAIYFGENSTLQKGRYKARAGEVDARRHVDENYENVCDFLGLRGDRVSLAGGSTETAVLIDVLSEVAVDGVVPRTEDDVWDDVMELPGDPEQTFRSLMNELQSRGLRLTCTGPTSSSS